MSAKGPSIERVLEMSAKGPSIERVLDGSAIKIDFYLKNVRFALRTSCHVPNIGDEVRLSMVVYKVRNRVFFFDEEFERVALDIVPLAKKYQPKR